MATFKLQPKGALVRGMNSNDQAVRRESRIQHAIWELLRLGININSSTQKGDTIQFDLNGHTLQFHPVHGKWLILNENIEDCGLGSLRKYILNIKQKGGIHMCEGKVSNAQESDWFSIHVDKLTNGYTVAFYGGADPNRKTYCQTEEEVEAIIADKSSSNIKKLVLQKST